MRTPSHQIQPFAGKGRSLPWIQLALLVFALAVAGCSSSSNGSGYDPVVQILRAQSAPTPGAAAYATNLLHEGDLVSIMFQYSTNFDAVQKIGLDGMLNLEMVGPVKAAGKSVTQLQSDLGVAYQTLAKDDVITVKLAGTTEAIYVSGAVLRPGMVDMDRPLTVLEAVMGAGGFDYTRAKLSAVSVLRIENGRQQTYHVNLNRVLDGKDTTPFYLKPYDIVYVPAKVFNY